MSRRDILRRGSLAALGLAAWVSRPAAARERPQTDINVFGDYRWLRGFSVVPSWGARIEEAWWNYDPERFREEVALATIVHANCIRLWIEFTAWMADPEKVTENFMDAVAAIDQAGMKTMPCLFNRWHNGQWDYGGQSIDDLMRRGWEPKLEYVRALVEPLVNDERILVWDLCNEPQAYNLHEEWEKREFEWLTKVAEAVRSAGARQPITIGTMNGSNIVLYAPLCDVLCGHVYDQSPQTLDKRLNSFDAIREKFAKPMLVNESIPGCLDDLRRAKITRLYTTVLVERGFGWMGWALREGKAVSTRRDRYDGNGLDNQGFLPYFTKSGRLRAGLDFLTEKPPFLPPWKKG